MYHTKQWREHLRPMVLLRDGYQCQRCGVSLTKGRTRDTDAVVNHKTPHKGNPDLFADPNNLEAVCKRCHDVVIGLEEQSTTPQIGPDGWPIEVGGGSNR